MSAARRPAVGSAVAILIIAGIAGCLSASHTTIATAVVAVAVGAGVCWALRTWVPDRIRLGLAGLALGTGSLSYVLFGGLSSGVLAVLLAAAMPPLHRRKGSLTVIWTAVVLLIVVGASVTKSQANLPNSMMFVLLCIALSAAWFIFDREAAGVTATVALQVAGVAAAVGVYASYVLGHRIFPAAESVSSAINDASPRASGFGSAPNQTAIILCAALIASIVQYSRAPGARPSRNLTRFLALALVIGGALLLTGSRSAVIGGAAALAISCVSVLIKRPSRALIAVLIIIVGAIALSTSQAFQGRSLNVLGSDDPSAVYRRSVQTRLWDSIDLHRLQGYGFVSGNAIAPNALTRDINNVDNAWLYAVLGFGALLTLGIALSLVLLLMRALGAGPVGLAPVPWIVLVTFAENVWVLAACASTLLLVLPAVATPIQRKKTHAHGASHLEHELVRHGPDESPGMGARP